MPSPASRKLIRSRVRHVTCFSSHLAVPGGRLGFVALSHPSSHFVTYRAFDI